jgi:hypothetical protein
MLTIALQAQSNPENSNLALAAGRQTARTKKAILSPGAPLVARSETLLALY